MNDAKIIFKTVVEGQKLLVRRTDKTDKILKVVADGQKSLTRRMDKTDRMLRAVINGQSSMKSDLLGEIGKVDKKVDGLKKKMDKGFREVSKRVDTIGLQLASLEDDAPTNEEFDKLEERVGKAELQIASM